MDKLTIEHLSCYLPYGLRVKHLKHKRNYNGLEYGILNGLYPLCATDGIYWQYTTYNNSTGQNIEDCMPCLRQFSDLAREIEHNGERFVPRHKFIGNPLDYKILHNSYSVVQQLLKWHFDVFGLIDKGLALNINEHEDKAGNR